MINDGDQLMIDYCTFDIIGDYVVVVDDDGVDDDVDASPWLTTSLW